MGNRLSKIYTRTGDDGSTGLGSNTRVEKDHIRIESIGTVDELNSVIGMILAEEIPEEISNCLQQVQHHLFDLGGELCMPGNAIISADDVSYLENSLDNFNNDLPYLKEFILPAGGRATSCCHLARTVCRRAERRLTSLNRDETINSFTLAYINRLSDLLFVIARVLARYERGQEVLWQPKQKP